MVHDHSQSLVNLPVVTFMNLACPETLFISGVMENIYEVAGLKSAMVTFV